jgi:pSer/pThr/pTyr-binding forkhead associated (FHA) protein
MDPRIVAVSGPLKGQVFRLAEGSLSIGRIPANRMAIPDTAVSRRHCIVELNDGHAEVADLHSHYGTLVNGVPVSRHALRHGDRVRVGQSELVFLSEDDTPHAAVSNR